jgi:hypothetical protein
VTTGATVSFIETATSTTFTRTITWQYSTNYGSNPTPTWSTENATAISGSATGSSFSFAVHCGMHTSNLCGGKTVQIWYRALISDTDATLLTYSYSPVITIAINSKPTTALTITSTSSAAIVAGTLHLATTGGGGTGSVSYSIITGGTGTGCAVNAGVLTVTHSGSCLVQPVQAADNDYASTTGITSTIFVSEVFVNYTNQWVAPVGTTGIGGTVASPGIENNNVANQAATFTVTGINVTSGAAGSTVIITGTGFQDGNGNPTITGIQYNLDNVQYTVNSSTQITATVPSSETSGTSDNFAVTSGSGANAKVALTPQTFSVP